MAEIWKPLHIDIYKDWVKAIEEEASDELTSWEIDFVESIKGKLEKGYKLSEKQAEVLERIYSEKTS